MEQDNVPEENGREKPKIEYLHTIFSVMSGFFGVQSRARRERDEAQGSVGIFILLGFLMTLILVVSIWLFVNLLIRLAG